jgi:transposase
MGSRKGRLGRSVADASLGELRRQLTNKCADRGGVLVCVDRFYPSSKTCSSCGSVKAKLDRSAIVFDCEHCGIVIDRDVNAARTSLERLFGSSSRSLASHTRQNNLCVGLGRGAGNGARFAMKEWVVCQPTTSPCCRT